MKGTFLEMNLQSCVYFLHHPLSARSIREWLLNKTMARVVCGAAIGRNFDVFTSAVVRCQANCLPLRWLISVGKLAPEPGRSGDL